MGHSGVQDLALEEYSRLVPRCVRCRARLDYTADSDHCDRCSKAVWTAEEGGPVRLIERRPDCRCCKERAATINTPYCRGCGKIIANRKRAVRPENI